MANLAPHVQAIVLLVQVILCAKLVNQDLAYKAISVTLVPLELISLAKLVSPVQQIVQHVQAVLFVRLVNQGLVYKVINVTPALQELI